MDAGDEIKTKKRKRDPNEKSEDSESSESEGESDNSASSGSDESEDSASSGSDESEDSASSRSDENSDDYGSDEDFKFGKENEDELIEEAARDSIASAKGRAKNKVLNPCPKEAFDKNLDKLAKQYKNLVVRSQGKFRRDDIIPPAGEGFTDAQLSAIRKRARDNFPGVFPKANKSGFVIFPPGYIKAKFTLPNNLLTADDDEQFKWLDEQLENEDDDYEKAKRKFKNSSKKYTWHHHQTKGEMQFVEMGIHGATKHIGGREIWGGGEAARKKIKGHKRQKTIITS